MRSAYERTGDTGHIADGPIINEGQGFIALSELEHNGVSVLSIGWAWRSGSLADAAAIKTNRSICNG